MFLGREAWGLVQVQRFVEKLALTRNDYPPMQAPASFNLDAAKASKGTSIPGLIARITGVRVQRYLGD